MTMSSKAKKERKRKGEHDSASLLIKKEVKGSKGLEFCVMPEHLQRSGLADSDKKNSSSASMPSSTTTSSNRSACSSHHSIHHSGKKGFIMTSCTTRGKQEKKNKSSSWSSAGSSNNSNRSSSVHSLSSRYASPHVPALGGLPNFALPNNYSRSNSKEKYRSSRDRVGDEDCDARQRDWHIFSVDDVDCQSHSPRVVEVGNEEEERGGKAKGTKKKIAQTSEDDKDDQKTNTVEALPNRNHKTIFKDPHAGKKYERRGSERPLEKEGDDDNEKEEGNRRTSSNKNSSNNHTNNNSSSSRGEIEVEKIDEADREEMRRMASILGELSTSPLQAARRPSFPGIVHGVSRHRGGGFLRISQDSDNGGVRSIDHDDNLCDHVKRGGGRRRSIEELDAELVGWAAVHEGEKNQCVSSRSTSICSPSFHQRTPSCSHWALEGYDYGSAPTTSMMSITSAGSSIVCHSAAGFGFGGEAAAAVSSSSISFASPSPCADSLGESRSVRVSSARDHRLTHRNDSFRELHEGKNEEGKGDGVVEEQENGRFPAYYSSSSRSSSSRGDGKKGDGIIHVNKKNLGHSSSPPSFPAIFAPAQPEEGVKAGDLKNETEEEEEGKKKAEKKRRETTKKNRKVDQQAHHRGQEEEEKEQKQKKGEEQPLSLSPSTFIPKGFNSPASQSSSFPSLHFSPLPPPSFPFSFPSSAPFVPTASPPRPTAFAMLAVSGEANGSNNNTNNSTTTTTRTIRMSDTSTSTTSATTSTTPFSTSSFSSSSTATTTTATSSSSTSSLSLSARFAATQRGGAALQRGASPPPNNPMTTTSAPTTFVNLSSPLSSPFASLSDSTRIEKEETGAVSFMRRDDEKRRKKSINEEVEAEEREGMTTAEVEEKKNKKRESEELERRSLQEKWKVEEEQETQEEEEEGVQRPSYTAPLAIQRQYRNSCTSSTTSHTANTHNNSDHTTTSWPMPLPESHKSCEHRHRPKDTVMRTRLVVQPQQEQDHVHPHNDEDGTDVDAPLPPHPNCSPHDSRGSRGSDGDGTAARTSTKRKSRNRGKKSSRRQPKPFSGLPLGRDIEKVDFSKKEEGSEKSCRQLESKRERQRKDRNRVEQESDGWIGAESVKVAGGEGTDRSSSSDRDDNGSDCTREKRFLKGRKKENEKKNEWVKKKTQIHGKEEKEDKEEDTVEESESNEEKEEESDNDDDDDETEIITMVPHSSFSSHSNPLGFTDSSMTDRSVEDEIHLDPPHSGNCRNRSTSSSCSNSDGGGGGKCGGENTSSLYHANAGNSFPGHLRDVVEVQEKKKRRKSKKKSNKEKKRKEEEGEMPCTTYNTTSPFSCSSPSPSPSRSPSVPPPPSSLVFLLSTFSSSSSASPPSPLPHEVHQEKGRGILFDLQNEELKKKKKCRRDAMEDKEVAYWGDRQPPHLDEDDDSAKGERRAAHPPRATIMSTGSTSIPSLSSSLSGHYSPCPVGEWGTSDETASHRHHPRKNVSVPTEGGNEKEEDHNNNYDNETATSEEKAEEAAAHLHHFRRNHWPGGPPHKRKEEGNSGLFSSPLPSSSSFPLPHILSSSNMTTTRHEFPQGSRTKGHHHYDCQKEGTFQFHKDHAKGGGGGGSSTSSTSASNRPSATSVKMVGFSEKDNVWIRYECESEDSDAVEDGILTTITTISKHRNESPITKSGKTTTHTNSSRSRHTQSNEYTSFATPSPHHDLSRMSTSATSNTSSTTTSWSSSSPSDESSNTEEEDQEKEEDYRLYPHGAFFSHWKEREEEEVDKTRDEVRHRAGGGSGQADNSRCDSSEVGREGVEKPKACYSPFSKSKGIMKKVAVDDAISQDSSSEEEEEEEECEGEAVAVIVQQEEEDEPREPPQHNSKLLKEDLLTKVEETLKEKEIKQDGEREERTVFSTSITTTTSSRTRKSTSGNNTTSFPLHQHLLHSPHPNRFSLLPPAASFSSIMSNSAAENISFTPPSIPKAKNTRQNSVTVKKEERGGDVQGEYAGHAVTTPPPPTEAAAVGAGGGEVPCSSHVVQDIMDHSTTSTTFSVSVSGASSAPMRANRKTSFDMSQRFLLPTSADSTTNTSAAGAAVRGGGGGSDESETQKKCTREYDSPPLPPQVYEDNDDMDDNGGEEGTDAHRHPCHDKRQNTNNHPHHRNNNNNDNENSTSEGDEKRGKRMQKSVKQGKNRRLVVVREQKRRYTPPLQLFRYAVEKIPFPISILRSSKREAYHPVPPTNNSSTPAPTTTTPSYSFASNPSSTSFRVSIPVSSIEMEEEDEKKEEEETWEKQDGLRSRSIESLSSSGSSSSGSSFVDTQAHLF